MNKIFITGATGYVGQRVALHLAAKGYLVHALVRSPQKSGLLNHPGITLFNGDISNKESLKAASAGCDVCIHSAGFSALYAPNPKLYHDINVKGSQLVFEAARENNLRKFIYISTAGVLGPSLNGPVNEYSPRKVPFFNEYETTKAKAEEWLLANTADTMPVASLNLTRVYGPGQLSEANAGTRLMLNVMKGWRIVPGNGESIGNYVYIDDVVTACESAITRAVGGHRYIIGGENLSFNRYFEVVKSVSGAQQKMISLPVSVILLMAYTMQALAVFGVKPYITPPWVRRYMYNWVLDVTKAREHLEYNPTSFEEGVKKTINWLKSLETQNSKETFVNA